VNICDLIIRDETTKKVSLIGLFNIINAAVFPAIHPILHVYAALTNGHGKYKANISFVRYENEKELMVANLEGELSFANPLQIVEINLCFQCLRFDCPGEYVVKILCDNEEVGSRKFIVMGRQQKPPITDGTEVK
jgi:hypothetical protein